MCGTSDSSTVNPAVQDSGLLQADISDLDATARFLAGEEGIRRTAVGFIGYSALSEGDRVLIAVDSQYDLGIPEAIARGLRDRLGARPDIIVVDVGSDRPFGERDEIQVIMRRESHRVKPRRYEGFPWVEDLAVANGYRMLIHGRGGGTGADPRIKNYEYIPWQQTEQFLSPATTYPRALHTLINQKAWDPIWNHGRGGRVHLTDPEGTDLTYTLWPEYFERDDKGFRPQPLWGHLLGHPMPPIIRQADATGTVAGTTNHFGRPFPRISLTVADGCVQRIDGGNGYGDGWRELLEETRNTQYPCFPRPGLFWLWEVAIGTNPKVSRPYAIHMQSSGGAEWERRRSGVIHMGFGTLWRDEHETWAAERGLLYGHLHVHLLFPTLDLTTAGGETFRIIDHGRLTSLDDPEVRRMADQYGNPDELLKEEWIPAIPGISAEGSYEDYARDPVPWIYPPEAQ